MSRRGLLGVLAGVALTSAMRSNRRNSGYNNMPRYGRRRSRGGLLGLIIMLAAGYYGSQHMRQPDVPVNLTPITGRVQNVIDGDTFQMQGYAIRLWGIDAPERDAASGAGATQTLQGLVRGRTLTCLPVDRSYERLVASCTMNGRDLSQAMVRLGWAKDLPNKSGRRYAADQADAQQARRGMWKI